MYYLIGESLRECSAEEIGKAGVPFVGVLTADEWSRQAGSLGISIDMEMETGAPRETKAVVNMDSLTGSFRRPSLVRSSGFQGGFSFALDEKGIILIDDSGYAERLTRRVACTKKWKLPSLERFIYDLLETAIAGDLALLEDIEKELNRIEESILHDEIDKYPAEMNDIRGDLLDLRVHYEQLIDLGQELQENENDFFGEENLRYFHMFTERVIRLQTMVSGERDYVTQLRDLLQAQLEVRQNTIMTVLTVITSIFLPLTLIAGWYGMNFHHMPELSWKYGYPAVIVVSVIIVAACLIWFRKKKWM